MTQLGWRQLVRGLMLTFLTALLCAAAFPPFNLSYLAWLGLAPLFWLIEESSVKSLFFWGWLCGFSFFGLHIAWISIFGIFLWLLLSLFQGFYWGLFGLGAGWFGQKNRWVVPFWWSGIELIRSLGPFGFTWGDLGYSQLETPLIKLAPLIGVYGISFCLVLINLALYWLLRRQGVAGSFCLAVCLALVLVPSFLSPAFTGETVKVALVQPSLFQEEKIDQAKFQDNLNLYFQLTQQAYPGRPDIVVWPESAYAASLNNNPYWQARLEELAQESSTYLLLGGFYSQGEAKHNSAFLVSPRREWSRYDKVNLVPFSEYLPFPGLFEKIPYQVFVSEPYASMLGDSLAAARQPRLLKFKGHWLGVGICFESERAFLVRKIARKGAEMLIFITNDAWFKKTAAPEQHFRITAMRAAETGLFTLQSANSGISGFINEQGRIVKKTELFTKKVLVEEARFGKSQTLFVKGGYLFPHFSLALAFLAIFYSLIWPRRARQAKV